jgi:catechol 2,3-dioxygenase-like lactoylglutathione lyase family enzyme
MYIAHIALWTLNVEKLKNFYVQFFGGRAGAKYTNPTKGFESYFITFRGGVALEIMQKYGVRDKQQKEMLGFCHIAFDLGSVNEVKEYTQELKAQGVRILSAPRYTGDGFFESVAADPDGNRVELICIAKKSGKF